METGALQIDLGAYKATLGGAPLALKPKELQLLAYFVRHEGRVLTRAAIAEAVWEREHLPTSNTIEAHVYELRRKMGVYGRWIQSLKGVGYRFEADEDAADPAR